MQVDVHRVPKGITHGATPKHSGGVVHETGNMVVGHFDLLLFGEFPIFVHARGAVGIDAHRVAVLQPIGYASGESRGDCYARGVGKMDREVLRDYFTSLSIAADCRMKASKTDTD